jgi:NAD(P)-dependent dehydrogenase (short-subunit alcohol dehydrogenase family)
MANNIVLVTGTSTGFGRLISTTLARSGYTVFASMRAVSGRNRGNAAEIEELARKENLRLHVVELDVTDDASVNRVVDRVIQDAGAIDVLVNNAGAAYFGLLETFTVEEAKSLFETNFFGSLRLNRAVLPHMRKRRSGLIVHMSSVAGRLVLPSMGIYCATKFALEAMAETLRYELSQLGIDSITVEPGPYPTAIFGNSVETSDTARAADYGPLAEVPRKVLNTLAAAQTNSQDVADRIMQLIEMPAGTRPLRTILGMEQFQAINDTALQVQTSAMHAFGFSDLLTLRRAERQVA